MFKGSSLAYLVSGLLIISALVILAEWHAIRSIAKGDHPAPGDAVAVPAPAAPTLAPAPAPARLRGAVAEASSAAGAAGAEGGVKWPLVPAFPTPREMRHAWCVDREYDLDALPRVSLVIPYLNETWFHIEKTVASMLAHTPLELVDEFLFIDDGNAKEGQHHEQLRALHPKIRVHRNEERQGLIRSKVIGAALVHSPVLLFMEPHCIVGKQWLEPLLKQLATSKEHTLLVMPTLDIIPENDFNRYTTANHHIGGFDWTLTFNWMALIEERNKSYAYPDPYPTPALSGGIFGIWRDNWERMGTYDTNMTEWGGEHIEMSLRTWRCGGRIEVVPCSRMGHVFRAKNPYEVHPMQVLKNTKRAALVWLDNRLENFYSAMPMARNLDAGDVTERLRLKESLHCNSMDWYVQNVYPELNEKQKRRR